VTGAVIEANWEICSVTVGIEAAGDEKVTPGPPDRMAPPMPVTTVGPETAVEPEKMVIVPVGATIVPSGGARVGWYRAVSA
jgi:hypothetical protein